MKKKIVALGLAISLLVPTVVQAATSYETEIEKGVNFRSAPSTNAYIFRMLSKGEDIHVIEKYNQYWLKIKVKDGTEGFISADPQYTDYKGSSPGSGQGTTNTKADRIINFAKSLQGRVTYDFGTRNPSKMIFDCSSFTEYVFANQGIDLKWGTKYQQNAGSAVSKSNLKKGDLVFFNTTGGSGINHVGIYIGNGQFIHNTPSKNGVAINSLNTGYWNTHYVKARRVL
ncbi:C40 family peptidase [Paenibacillus koleovorans]|uniref:C40 family peptidase n=1 Tax=Paenibacillus koleovorans TaxID=121608 RepID=UPI000FDB5663|nr:SH3 domain-containing C40 family peptidase [Paenibacillus koleovorans]